MSSEPVTGTDATWAGALLHMSDAFYPTGSYAHSFGLEGMVSGNVVRDRDSLREYIAAAVLPALSRTELPLARHAWAAFEPVDWGRIESICRLSSALRTPREARTASENIGRQRVELLAALRPHPLVAEYIDRAAVNAFPYSAPVAAALEGRVAGAPLPAVLAGIIYSALSALIAAAMKLLRLGQNAAHTLLAEALARVPELVMASALVTFDEIGWSNPWLDIASARHERADLRLFIS